MQNTRDGRTILIGEDEPEVRGYLEMALKCQGYSVELAEDGDEVLSCLKTPRPDICALLLDIIMPNRDGMETLREVRRSHPTMPIIIVSGASSTLNVVAAMKNGATDFICKPVVHEELLKVITRALEIPSAQPLRRPRPAAQITKCFFGSTKRIKEIQALLYQVGWSEAPILIQGETGTGKEVFARELHAQSPRANKPFLKLNCAALPSELVESELFGYERGAFTGAFQRKAGMFEVAHGGTILLDEIGDMDVRLQAKLLQVLQDHEFQRIGGKETVKVDVRVMAATHRCLEKAIADRSFREDLYYRLNVINLVIPPLRERKEDLISLTEFLVNKHAAPEEVVPTITMDLKHAMMTYHWPGNVRELENFVRKFLILRNAEDLARELYSKSTRKPLAAAAAPQPETRPPAREPQPEATPILEQVTKAKQQAETEAILAALNFTRWNRKQAAALLKIDYKALLYKMKKLGVDEEPLPLAAANEISSAATSAAAGNS